MNIKKHIPNFLTCCNLFCGCIGMVGVAYHDLFLASYCIYIACIFDFLDGFAARMLKVSSAIGKDLDSLADMVTFGVLPGFIVFRLMLESGNPVTSSLLFDLLNGRDFSLPLPEGYGASTKYDVLIYFSAFIIPVFSAIRLAKFNNDNRQSDRFIGLPTPANALFISALPFIFARLPMNSAFGTDSYPFPYYLIILSIILSYLLVAELPLIALKFKNFGWPDNEMRYTLIISAVILLIILNFTAIPLIIILYIILSLIDNYLNKNSGDKVKL